MEEIIYSKLLFKIKVADFKDVKQYKLMYCLGYCFHIVFFNLLKNKNKNNQRVTIKKRTRSVTLSVFLLEY